MHSLSLCVVSLKVIAAVVTVWKISHNDILYTCKCLNVPSQTIPKRVTNCWLPQRGSCSSPVEGRRNTARSRRVHRVVSSVGSWWPDTVIYNLYCTLWYTCSSLWPRWASCSVVTLHTEHHRCPTSPLDSFGLRMTRTAHIRRGCWTSSGRASWPHWPPSAVTQTR